MRISDWSSDVCSSDLTSTRFSALAWDVSPKSRNNAATAAPIWRNKSIVRLRRHNRWQNGGPLARTARRSTTTEYGRRREAGLLHRAGHFPSFYQHGPPTLPERHGWPVRQQAKQQGQEGNRRSQSVRDAAP